MRIVSLFKNNPFSKKLFTHLSAFNISAKNNQTHRVFITPHTFNGDNFVQQHCNTSEHPSCYKCKKFRIPIRIFISLFLHHFKQSESEPNLIKKNLFNLIQ